MKALLKLLLLLGMVTYLVIAFTHFTRQGDKTVCSSVKVAVSDSLNAGFITQEEVCRILKKNKVYPVGQLMDSINGRVIETTLNKHSFIKSTVCYKGPGGRINILVEQRMPVMRIMAANGEDYYIDEEGFAMRPDGYEANLVVATGQIDKAYARKYLVRLGKHLQTDDFWNNQIEQINVTPEGCMEMVPRVGDHMLYMGKPVNLQRKLNNLRTFYEKVMPTVGWSKYSLINLEYENQVICTKSRKS